MAGNEITVDDRDLIIAVLRGAATTWREAAADPASGALRSHYLTTACAANALAEKLERLGAPGWLTAGLAKAAELDAHRMLPPPGSPIEILAQVVINSIDTFGCFTAAAAEGCYFETEEAYPDGPSLCIPVTMHVPSRWCPHFIVTVTPDDLAEEGTDD